MLYFLPYFINELKIYIWILKLFFIKIKYKIWCDKQKLEIYKYYTEYYKILRSLLPFFSILQKKKIINLQYIHIYGKS